ncbi:MAG: hypothetical protein PUD07_04295 [bacterium]|nr:hypothetical protein [bacterium]
MINRLNKKGVISISVIYSFFLVFCLLLVLILTTYTNNRINFKMLKNDIKKKYISSEEITTSLIGSKIDTTLMPYTDDDMGTTYYYNGRVDNNYIKFGDNMLWRIIRVNGDGSIRLIYEGTIGNSSYNSSSNDAIYVGYKYSLYNNHGLGNNSTIKDYLDTWYNNNLSETKYENYIVGSIFCTNRNAFSDPNNHNITNNADGYGTSTQYFENYNKTVSNLECSNSDDKFYINSSYNSNGILDYPIGLLSYEEAVLMGLNKITNNPNSFLTNESDYWTLTPSHYNDGAYNYYISSNGILSNNRKVSDSIAVRPVISISANTPVIGVGTKKNPYTFSLGGRKFNNICSGGAI